MEVVDGDQPAPVRKTKAQRPPPAAPKTSMGLVFVVIIVAFALFVVGWMAVRSTGPRPMPAVPDAVVDSSRSAAPELVQTAGASTQVRVEDIPQPVESARPSLPQSSGTAELPSSPATNEVLPDVPQRARQSIRGRVRVSVRLIVDKQGKVFAALVEQPGPSRYFEKLALEAAEQWVFPPSASGAAERLMLIRFDFSRAGATARAEAVK
jgi:TonB family protein